MSNSYTETRILLQVARGRHQPVIRLSSEIRIRSATTFDIMSGRNQRGGTSPRQYRGIRMRRCGKWVSEIREPSTRTRIWFGSFGTAEEAARAYDAALVCITGFNARVNFPDEAPTIPRGTPGGYTAREIQAAAAAWAAASVGRPFSYSDFMSRKAADSHDGQGREDVTYTEPAQAALPTRRTVPDPTTAGAMQASLTTLTSANG
jgi:hypothetical protein